VPHPAFSPHAMENAPSPCGRGLGEGSRDGAEDLRLLHARGMRREPTEPERVLWKALRTGGLGGLKFRRQVPFGRYIVDFYCASAKLAVEVDGATHADSERDAVRDAWLSARGIRVLRFWNNEVMLNLPGVLQAILGAATPPPGPLPQGEGEK